MVVAGDVPDNLNEGGFVLIPAELRVMAENVDHSDRLILSTSQGAGSAQKDCGRRVFHAQITTLARGIPFGRLPGGEHAACILDR